MIDAAVTMRYANGMTYRDAILSAAMDLARKDGWPNGITRDKVAAVAGVGTGTVNWVFGTVGKLRDEVMRNAIDREEWEIVAQGLANGSDVAKSAPREIQVKALASLI